MIRGYTLARYFGRQYFLWFLVFLLSILSIVFILEATEFLRRAIKHSSASLPIILEMAFYKTPTTVQKILPFVVLFSAMFTFWRLTRNHELVIARAAGISVWQFLLPSIMITILFSAFNLIILNPIEAAFNTRCKNMEALYFGSSPSLELTGAGLWIRQEDAKHQYLIHADRVTTNPLTLTPIMGLIYDHKNHYLGRFDGAQGILRDGFWDIEQAWFNWNDTPRQIVPSYRLPTTITFKKIQESMANPDSISIWQLPKFIDTLRAIGLPYVRHTIRLQSLLAQPVMLCAMLFFAAAFSLRMSRRSNIRPLIFYGLALGISLYILNNITIAIGINKILPVMLAVWAVPVSALILSIAALLYLEDG